MLLKTYQQAKRVVRIIVGFTVLAIGVALLVLPGPAFIVIPIGLAILATEFVWARRLLQHVRERAEKVRDSVVNSRDRSPAA